MVLGSGRARFMRLGRMFVTSVLTLVALLGTTSPARATSISGAILFSSDSAGDPSGGQIWNTQGVDCCYNLYFSTTSDASSGFLNSGDGPSTSISIALVPGTTTFFVFGSPGSDPTGVAALNLFFNGNNFSPSSPGITAFNQTNSAATGLSAASAASTLDLGAASVTSPQTLTFADGSTTVLLTSFAWTTDSTAVDLVSPGGIVADGGADFFGSFTVQVTTGAPVPEPATILLFGTSAAGLGLARWRQRRLKKQP